MFIKLRDLSDTYTGELYTRGGKTEVIRYTRSFRGIVKDRPLCRAVKAPILRRSLAYSAWSRKLSQCFTLSSFINCLLKVNLGPVAYIDCCYDCTIPQGNDKQPMYFHIVSGPFILELYIVRRVLLLQTGARTEILLRTAPCNICAISHWHERAFWNNSNSILL